MKRTIAATLLSVLPFAVGAFAQEKADTSNFIKERYRPQFHYTTIKGWINDPIGLVYYKGEYHLFNDHNPFSCGFPGGLFEGEQSHWSHAISPDLVHWKHMPIAVYPDKLGACWSGSGVVDWRNTAGFQTGDEPPLVLAYTSAGSFTQGLVYSNDRGRTWKKYENNPVLKQIAGKNRDPMVFWHEPTRKWVMVLYVTRGKAHFFNSDNLKKWTPTSIAELGSGFHECFDLFELPIDGDKNNRKWVLHDARSTYFIGQFDGKAFTPESGALRAERGKSCYAPQSWHNTGERRIQIGWMRSKRCPEMPFSQQSTFPCELSLRTTPKGIRLFRSPVREIESLYGETFTLKHKTLKPGENPLEKISGELFDIELEIQPGDAAEFGLRLHETGVTWASGEVSALGCTAEAAAIDGAVHLRMLVDRTSIETFVNDGALSMTSFFMPKEKTTGLELYAKDGDVNIRSLRVTKLKSCWSADKPAGK